MFKQHFSVSCIVNKLSKWATQISPPQSQFKEIVAIIGLPRSGTTLAASIFDAHPRTVTCYEPWNRVSGEGLESEQMPQDLVVKFNLDVTPETDIFVLKETSVDFKGIQWLAQFLRANADTHRVQIVWSLRNYRHTYLSFVQGAREWWGHENMTPEVSGYNLYMEKALKATVALLRLYQEFPGTLYAYEALTADPAIAIPLLMGALDLIYSDQQLDYLQHFSPGQVRGDVSMSKDPRPISGDSVTKREAEWSRYHQEFSGSSGDFLRQQLDAFWQQIERQTLISGAVPAASLPDLKAAKSVRPGHEYRETFSSIEEWRDFLVDNPAIVDSRRIHACGRAIALKGFGFRGHLIKPSELRTIQGDYRESFVHNKLSACKRALLLEMFHDIRSRQIELKDARVYASEASGGIAEFLAGQILHFCSSEYLPDSIQQKNSAHVDRQDLAALPYEDASFDYVLVSETLEYISNLNVVLTQIHRVLAPGGVALSTFQFAISSKEHQATERLEPDGRVDHLMEPQYHGDHVDNRDMMVSQLPGWNILEDCRSLGFASAEIVLLSSPARGVLASEISGVILLKAVKSS